MMNDTISRYLSILCYPFASLDFFFEDYLEEIAAGQGDCRKTEGRLREAVDGLEVITASEVWPYPSYTELLFSVK